MVGASGRSVTTVTRSHAGCLPRGPRHQTNLSYEPDKDKRGLLMVVVLTVLMVLMALMVMVLVKVMAARDGECHCDGPASIWASQCWRTRLGRSGAATHILTRNWANPWRRMV